MSQRMGRRVNMTDCEELRKSIDPACAFNQAAVNDRPDVAVASDVLVCPALHGQDCVPDTCVCNVACQQHHSAFLRRIPTPVCDLSASLHQD